jgi:hypothetical protein
MLAVQIEVMYCAAAIESKSSATPITLMQYQLLALQLALLFLKQL